MTTVNLVFWDNGFGLSRDSRLLADALRRNGCEVTLTALGLKQEHRRRRKWMRPYVRTQQLWRGLRRHWRPPAGVRPQHHARTSLAGRARTLALQCCAAEPGMVRSP